MKILRAFKYRLYPTPKQEANLRQQVGNTRFLWNKLLETNTKFYKLTGRFLWYPDLNDEINKLKQQYHFLKLSGSQSLQQVAKHLDRALREIKKTKGYPKFKKKVLGGSFAIPQTLKFRENEVFIPKVAYKRAERWVKMVKHRPLEGKPKHLTVSLDVDQWFVSILCEVEVDVKPKDGQTIGVDLGLESFATTNDGTKIANPRYLKKAQKRLKRYQRKLSKKKKGSNNRNKQRIKVAKTHRKVRRQRSDFLHKASSQLIAKASVICAEDLNVHALQMSRLSKPVSDVGWGEFVRQLEYKCKWYGVEFRQANRFYASSKVCSNCGNKKKDLQLSDRTYICESCGLEIDRDVNAAINLSTVGAPGINACGDTSVGAVSNTARHVSRKQENFLKAKLLESDEFNHRESSHRYS